jgi:hypothetical protein
MRHEVATDLPKLGHREYIQGGSIFNGMLDFADQRYGPDWLEGAVISSFKLQRESFGNGRILLAEAAVPDIDPHAALVVRSAGREIHGYYFDDGRSARREPYDEDSYFRVLRLGPGVGGEFVLPAERRREDFIRGIVGANKRVHAQSDTFGGPLTHIQFLYLRDLDAMCLRRAGEGCRLTISNVTTQDRGTEVWTINRVEVHGESFRSEFRICYRGTREVR